MMNPPIPSELLLRYNRRNNTNVSVFIIIIIASGFVVRLSEEPNSLFSELDTQHGMEPDN